MGVSEYRGTIFQSSILIGFSPLFSPSILGKSIFLETFDATLNVFNRPHGIQEKIPWRFVVFAICAFKQDIPVELRQGWATGKNHQKPIDNSTEYSRSRDPNGAVTKILAICCFFFGDCGTPSFIGILMSPPQKKGSLWTNQCKWSVIRVLNVAQVLYDVFILIVQGKIRHLGRFSEKQQIFMRCVFFDLRISLSICLRQPCSHFQCPAGYFQWSNSSVCSSAPWILDDMVHFFPNREASVFFFFFRILERHD